MSTREAFEAEFAAADREYREAFAALDSAEQARWSAFMVAYYNEEATDSMRRKVATTILAYESGDERFSPALHRMYRAFLGALKAVEDLPRFYPSN